MTNRNWFPDPRIDFDLRLRDLERMSLSNPLRSLLDQVLETVDRVHLSEIRMKWRDEISSYSINDKNDIKYLDIPYFALSYCKRFLEAKFSVGGGKGFLDIGSGPGLFCSIAGVSGFSAKGLDIENELYADLCELLGVKREISRVLPMQPVERRNDKYYAISVVAHCFDKKLSDSENRKIYWGREEWKFFFCDLVSRLENGGTLYLELNERSRAVHGISNEEIYSLLPSARIDLISSRPKARIYRSNLAFP